MSMRDELPSCFSVLVSIRLGSEIFAGQVDKLGENFAGQTDQSGAGYLLSASWQHGEQQTESLTEIISDIGQEIPKAFEFSFDLEEIRLTYRTDTSAFNLICRAKDWFVLFSLKISAKLKEYTISAGMPQKRLMLGKLPILGYFLKSEDYLRVSSVGIRWGIRTQLTAELGLVLFSCKEMEINIPAPEAGMELSVPKAGMMPALKNAQTGPSVMWLKLNKKIGPISLGRVGVGLNGSHIALLLDLGVAFSVLALDFYGLQLDIPVQDGDEFAFSLQGIGASFQNNVLKIKGLLLRERRKGALEYNGFLTLSFAKVMITAQASYLEEDGKSPSFFAYAMLGYPLGGPPCFFVTGLAAGFGVNRRIVLPSVQELDRFPLIQAVTNGCALRPDTTPRDALENLKSCIVPGEGQSFLAAGIRFSSFGVADSFAMLTVSFGKKFTLDLLGTTSISMPPNTARPIAFARINLKVTVDPDEGVLGLLACLSSESYVLDKSCRLMGGAAFFIWFAGTHRGDFILSVGGYHPSFKVPAHYPQIDRLGVCWNISRELCLKGNAYVCCTSSCVMAGGELSLTFQTGPLKAWLYVGADFLIQWKPLYFDIYVSVSVGVSYTLKIGSFHHTFALELGAQINLYGPPFSGKMRISLAIISFTIWFNDKTKQQPDPLDWDNFRKDFLSPPKPAAMDLQTEGISTLCTLVFSDGIEQPAANNSPTVVNASQTILSVQCQVPCKSVCWYGEESITEFHEDKDLHIQPMKRNLDSSMEIHIYYCSNPLALQPVWTACGEYWHCEELFQDFPKAVWGREKSEVPDSEFICDVLCGVSLRPKQQGGRRKTNTYPLENLMDGGDCTREGEYCSPVLIEQTARRDIKAFADSIEEKNTSLRRLKTVKDLEQLGLLPADTDIDINGLAQRAALLYSQGPWMLNTGVNAELFSAQEREV